MPASWHWQLQRSVRLAGCDRKTVRKFLARGAEEPRGKRRRRRGAGVLSPYEEYLSSRIESHPGLSGCRLYRDIAEMGYADGYTTVTNYLRQIRAASPPPFKRSQPPLMNKSRQRYRVCSVTPASRDSETIESSRRTALNAQRRRCSALRSFFLPMTFPPLFDIGNNIPILFLVQLTPVKT